MGDAGILIGAPAEPAALAAAVRDALERGPQAGAEARQRVLCEFSLDARAAALHDLVERALAGR